MMHNEKMEKLIANLGELPTLPVVIQKINALLSNPRTTATEVGQAIAADQAIAAKIISLVNSALYGFPGRISTITHAIVILGFSTVKNVILTTTILSRFDLKKSVNGFDMMGLWRHSVATGSIARLIASEIGYRGKEEAFVGGLLHDLGKVVHALYLPESFVQVVRLADSKHALFYDAEIEIHGVSHVDIGAWVAEKWNLPADLTAVIALHHTPMKAGNHAMLVSIVHLADILARGMDCGNPGDNTIPIIDLDAWKMLGITETQLLRILDLSKEEMERASVFLTVND
jgi:putative nucleotidyltransferase with HDIG domain